MNYVRCIQNTLFIIRSRDRSTFIYYLFQNTPNYIKTIWIYTSYIRFDFFLRSEFIWPFICSNLFSTQVLPQFSLIIVLSSFPEQSPTMQESFSVGPNLYGIRNWWFQLAFWLVRFLAQSAIRRFTWNRALVKTIGVYSSYSSFSIFRFLKSFFRCSKASWSSWNCSVLPPASGWWIFERWRNEDFTSSWDADFETFKIS